MKKKKSGKKKLISIQNFNQLFLLDDQINKVLIFELVYFLFLNTKIIGKNRKQNKTIFFSILNKNLNKIRFILIK